MPRNAKQYVYTGTGEAITGIGVGPMSEDEFQTRLARYCAQWPDEDVEPQVRERYAVSTAAGGPPPVPPAAAPSEFDAVEAAESEDE